MPDLPLIRSVPYKHTRLFFLPIKAHLLTDKPITITTYPRELNRDPAHHAAVAAAQTTIYKIMHPTRHLIALDPPGEYTEGSSDNVFDLAIVGVGSL